MRWGGRRDSEIRELPRINGRDERTSVAVAVAVAAEREKKEEKIQFKRKLYFHRLHLLFFTPLSLSLPYIYIR